jgi:multicomponent Na+:H+ antiporter subunit C
VTYFFAAAVAAYMAGGIYMMLSRHAVRMILGLALLTNGAILLIFFSGRMDSTQPPVVPLGGTILDADAANALPQALVLTAIVIGFAMTAFTMVLALVAGKMSGTLNTNKMSDFDLPASKDKSPNKVVKSS